MKNYFSFFQGLPGFWSRGKFYPAIMGGSDGGMSGGDSGGGTAVSAQAGQAAAMLGGTEETGSGTESDTKSQESSDNSFVREVLGSLEDVDESERPVLEKYLKSIDAQVNSKFQGIHDQYSAFKDMDADEVQKAMGLATLVQEDPEKVLSILGEALGYEFDGMGEDEDGEYDDGTESEYEDDEDGEFQLPPQFQQQWDHMQEIVEAMAEIVLENQESSKAQKEDEELEQEIEALRDQYGDFDEDFVLSWAAANEADLDTAVKYYNDFVERIRGEAAPQPPKVGGGPVLSGGGVPSNDVVDPRKMDGSQTKNLVAQLIAASGQE